MEVTDLLSIITNPQFWPLFLAFLGGYVMMNIFLGRGKVQKYSELEKILIAFVVGVLFWYFLFLPPIVMANFWFNFLGGNTYLSSAIVFCTVSSAVLLLRIYKVPPKEIISIAKRVLLAAIVIFASSTIFSLTIGIGVSKYPLYSFALLRTNWSQFTQLSATALILFLFGVGAIAVFIFRISFQNIKVQINQAFKKKRSFFITIAAIVLVMIIGFLIVPLDMTFTLFTPQMEKRPEVTLSNLPYGTIYIHAVKNPVGQTVTATYDFYEVLETSYDIAVPKVYPFLKSVYISNPSNTSFLMSNGGISYPDLTENNWGLFVSVPENVTYQADLRGESPKTKVNGVTVSFVNFTEGSRFFTNITYWQKVDLPENVEITYHDLTITDLENGTWIETHEVDFKNNSNDTFSIPALIYDTLN